MLPNPKTLPATATVGEVRALFSNPHVETALLVDGAAFAGLLDRPDFPADAPGEAPARDYFQTDVEQVTPETPLAEAMEWLDRTGHRRLVVVDAEDRSTLRGLLCLDRDRVHFCDGSCGH